jgi:hypothetical protein
MMFANLCRFSTYADSKVESYLGGFVVGPSKVAPTVTKAGPIIHNVRGEEHHVNTWHPSVAPVQNQLKFVESNSFHRFHAGKLPIPTQVMDF